MEKTKGYNLGPKPPLAIAELEMVKIKELCYHQRVKSTLSFLYTIKQTITLRKQFYFN